jgi:hypothetical protein
LIFARPFMRPRRFRAYHLISAGEDFRGNRYSTGATRLEIENHLKSGRLLHGNPIARRQRRKLNAPAGEEHVASDMQSVGALAQEGGEGRIN